MNEMCLFLRNRSLDVPPDADYSEMKAALRRNLPENNYIGWSPDQLVQALGLQLSPLEYNYLLLKAQEHQRAPRFFKRYNLQWSNMAWRLLYSMEKNHH